MNATVKGSLYTAIFFVTSEIVYKLYCKFLESRKSTAHQSHCGSQKARCPATPSLQVLFFPDSEVACREYFITGNGCYKSACQYSHSNTALSELYKHMLACTSTLDVCVFVMTCKDLADVLIRLFRRGVKIRVITDNEQLQASGSQIWELIRYGIPVRTNNSSYLMHHKFAVVDGSVLINGSFNWTRQAITGNQENLIITNDQAITPMFVNEFQKLWDAYDPERKHADKADNGIHYKIKTLKKEEKFHHHSNS